MLFHSTLNPQQRISIAAAISNGLAEDGGLYVPEHLPTIDYHDFLNISSYAEFAAKLLSHFFQDDPLSQSLPEFCQRAFNFPIPLRPVNEQTWLMELFHGPTLSFKDFGARFLAECLNQLSTNKKTTIMVATSGDTGSAVAAAFHQKANINAIVLYPFGKISARQEQQMICWQDNIRALAVEGSFDDCQRLVKSAFQDPWWQQHTHLSTANSINIGRLLPQIVYYAYSSLQFFKQHHTQPGYVVPSGNLGNVTAAFFAKTMGFPIREVSLALNANRVVLDYLETGHYQPQTSIVTLANAMDVGKPSNFERLQHLFPTFTDFCAQTRAFSATDQQIITAIKEAEQQHHIILCPHTATAYHARQYLSNDQPWILVATADPCKFDTIIEPIINRPVPVSPALQKLLDRPSQRMIIQPSLAEINKFCLSSG